VRGDEVVQHVKKSGKQEMARGGRALVRPPVLARHSLQCVEDDSPVDAMAVMGGLAEEGWCVMR
jgi:hypothetical protein